MGNKNLFILCIPTVLTILIFGSVTWGMVVGVNSKILCGVVLFLPSQNLIKANSRIALESLAYGDSLKARDHIEIALREAQRSTNICVEDLDLPRTACFRGASALAGSG